MAKDKVKELFDDVGDVLETFSCAYDGNTTVFGKEVPISQVGTLYVTEQALCFYSDLFKTKITLPFANIALVLREATLGVDTALSVRTSDRTVYMFRSFIFRDSAFELISARSEAARKSAESLNMLDALSLPKKPFGFEIPKLSFGKKK